MTAAIQAFVGLNGTGKTCSMVRNVAIPAWERGQMVTANFRLYPERLGFDPGLYQPLVTDSVRECTSQVAELRESVLLLSEITQCFPARQWTSMGAEFAGILDQLRKPKVVVCWDGPTWSRCDKNLRDVTQLVTVCSASFPDRWVREPKLGWFPPRARNAQGDVERESPLWAPNRLMRQRSYRREDFDEFEATRAAAKLKPVARGMFWRPLQPASIAYDTGERVTTLAHLQESSSICGDCGGARPKPKCTCEVPGGGRPGGRTLAPGAHDLGR